MQYRRTFWALFKKDKLVEHVIFVHDEKTARELFGDSADIRQVEVRELKRKK